MRKAALVVLAVAVNLGIASPALAGTTRHEFECTATMTQLVDEGTLWIEDGSLHMRGFLAVYDVVGDDLCAGTLVGGANFNLDLATWSGVVWGTATLDVDAYDGGWHARLVAHFIADDPLRPDATDIWIGDAIRHGYGELQGWQARATMLETTHASYVENGYAFEPGN